MPAPNITALPTAPSREDAPQLFASRADAWVAAIATLTSEINAFGDYLDGLGLDPNDIPDATTAAKIWAGTEDGEFVTPDAMLDAAAFQTLTDGETITPDFGAGFNFKVTLEGDRTLANPTNAKDGQSGTIMVTQDANGSQTLTYGNKWRFPGGASTGGALSTAANSVDLIAYIVGSDGNIYATLSKAFAA